MNFLLELYQRNPSLAVFGWLSLLGALTCAIIIPFSNNEVLGINAFIKPLKFYLSTVFFVWSIAWYMYYLPEQKLVNVYTWIVIAVMTFELVYITYMASQGQKSHFNVSSNFHALMWSLMGSTVGFMVLFLCIVNVLFFVHEFPELPSAYVWGIRFGILLFIIFAFEGFVMGAKMSHTIGGPDGGPGIPFFNWSVKYGDLRVAHFFGMHALQVLPIVAFFWLKDVKFIWGASFIYFLIASFILYIALNAKPLIKLGS